MTSPRRRVSPSMSKSLAHARNGSLTTFVLRFFHEGGDLRSSHRTNFHVKLLRFGSTRAFPSAALAFACGVRDALIETVWRGQFDEICHEILTRGSLHHVLSWYQLSFDLKRVCGFDITSDPTHRPRSRSEGLNH
jgi:hypothetical protein